MKNLSLLVLSLTILSGCSSTLGLSMKLATWELFEVSCSSDKCRDDVELYLDECFDVETAEKTIHLETFEEKCFNNVKLINEMKTCYLDRGVTDFEEADLPLFFYTTINANREKAGKAPYSYPCAPDDK